MTHRGRTHRAVLAAALCAVGCTSTETGNPPAQPDTGLELGDVTFLMVPNMSDPGLLSGFVQMNVPFGAELHVTAVDTTLDTVRTPIVGDPLGFSTSLPAGFSGWLRLQVVAIGGPEFGPLDVLTSDAAVGGMVEPLPSPVGDCLEVPSMLTLDADGAANLELLSRCDAPLTFDAPLARLSGVSVTPDAGFTLGRNQRRTLVIARTGAFPTGDPEVLVLREASGERRAVTIRE